MAYNATYTATDAAPALIDLGLTVIVGFVAFASIIGIILLIRWMKGKKTKVL